MSTLSRLSNDELMQAMHRLLATHRRNTASIVEHLAEMDHRRVAVELGYTSLFAYCRDALGFTEDEAYRRIAAARISRRFPVALAAIADGSVSLTVLALLKPHLTTDNSGDLLDLVRNTTVQVAKERIAARFPRADVRERLRRLAERPVEAAPGSAGQLEGPQRRLDPLSSDRFALTVTVSRAIKEDLELARDLMRHRSPDGDLECVIGNALALLVKRLRAEKFGERDRPQRKSATESAVDPNGSTRSGRARVTNASRREVVQREGLGCDFVGPGGHRCGAMAFLEFDHAEPVGLGGGSEAKNIRQRCRAHNQLEADRIYGKGYMNVVRRKIGRRVSQSATNEA